MSGPEAWGVEPGYHRVDGRWEAADPEAVAAALEAMGGGPDRDPPPADVWVVRAGERVHCAGAWSLRMEDGATAEGRDDLPTGLPLGYHELEREDGSRSTRLIVAPASCHLPPGLRTWGWAAQLYSVRSTRSWGMGDLADLADLGRWARSLGAGVVLLNPLHSALPGHPQQPSPYYPSSRCFHSPLYIRVEDVPGAGEEPAVEAAARAGRALNARPTIDRDAVWDLKIPALEALWRASRAREGRDAGFAGFGARRGAALESYAAFCAISEVHGRAWRDWPAELRRPGTPAVAEFASRHSDRVRFHAWLQWLMDDQLARAGEVIGLVTDLAIGTDPGGFDAWMWQDALAEGVRVGAPPDEFNPAGQDWGFPPYDPWRLRSAGFEPFVQVVRSALAHAAGLRIDHVAGLYRLYWIPPGADPARGVYVRYPWQELLSVLALEGVRAGAWVVGEDLGTVEPVVREDLGRRDVLSTKVFWFEDVAPRHYPERSLAVVTTHDLPTVAGVWTGEDLEDQRECGVEADPGTAEALRDRLREWSGLPADASVGDVVVATHRLLAEAPSAVVLAGLEDALAVARRPNLPGTVDERPNWRQALPRPLEALGEDPLALAVAEALARGRGDRGNLGDRADRADRAGGAD